MADDPRNRPRPLGSVSRPRMQTTEREDLLIHVLRCPPVRSEARLLLVPEAFTQASEKPHAVILRHFYKLLDSGAYPEGDIPEHALFHAMADEILEMPAREQEAPWVDALMAGGLTAGDEVRPDGAQPGLLARCFLCPAARLSPRYGFDLLKRFLEERTVADRITRIVELTGGKVVEGYGALLREVQFQHDRVQALGATPFSVPLPELWVPKPLRRFRTGCDWADKHLGGQVAGDVNGLVGPFGGGKTTALVQLATESAGYLLAMARAANQPPGYCLVVTFEEEEELIRSRILACAARVSKSKLEELGSIDELTRTGGLSPYEAAMYAAEGVTDPAEMLGEYERLQAAGQKINANLRIMDMCRPGLGYGWIDEVAAHVGRLVDDTGIKVDVIVLDYVNAMVRKYLHAQNKDLDRQLRHYVQATPLEAKEKLARRFDCVVWLAQQFSGEANDRSAVAKMYMSDTGEARNFCENLVFCVGLGIIDPVTKCMQTHYLKARRRGVQGTTDIARLDGDLARIHLAADHYTVDNRTHRIVERKVYNQFEGLMGDSPAIKAVLSKWQAL